MTLSNLTRFFSHRKKNSFIELAYLFGSRASGTQGPISDYDIAILYSQPQPLELRFELEHELKILLATDRVDLIILNCAPIELRYAVIANGIAVYEASTAARVEYEALTLSIYGDYLPILRRQRREILEEDNHEAGVQRYRAALGKTQHLLDEIRAL